MGVEGVGGGWWGWGVGGWGLDLGDRVGVGVGDWAWSLLLDELQRGGQHDLNAHPRRAALLAVVLLLLLGGGVPLAEETIPRGLEDGDGRTLRAREKLHLLLEELVEALALA